MAHIRGASLGCEAPPAQEVEHLGRAVLREAELAAQPPIIGESRAHEPEQRRAEEAALPGEGEEGPNIVQRPGIRRDHVREDEPAAHLEHPAPGAEKVDELVGGQVLQERVHDHEVERAVRDRLHLLGREHADRADRGEAHGQTGSDQRGAIAEIQDGTGLGDPVGRERLAATVIHDDRAGTRQHDRDVARDRRVMQTLVPVVHIDRRVRVPVVAPAHARRPDASGRVVGRHAPRRKAVTARSIAR